MPMTKITSVSACANLGKLGLSEAQELEANFARNNILTFSQSDGGIIGLKWPYHPPLQQAAKKRKGSWNGSYWEFLTVKDANSQLKAVQKEFPGFPVISATGKSLPESLNEYFVTKVSANLSVCLLRHKLSINTSIPHLLSKVNTFVTPQVDTALPLPTSLEADIHTDGFSVRVFNVNAENKACLAVISTPRAIAYIADCVAAAGAKVQPALALPFHMQSKVKISTSNWAVAVRIDLTNPLHWPLLQGTKSEGDGWAKASTTRSKWPAWRTKISDAGLVWEGEDPESQELTIPSIFDANLVAGWNKPAPNGYLLHDYQKKGVQFCALRGMRAIIGDEMGIGKTVQAIAAAEATSARRVIIICPANARYVWDAEIRGWGGQGSIQHINNKLETLDLTARWHILTYDLIGARNETLRLHDAAEVKAFIETFPEFSNREELKQDKYPFKISIEKPLDAIPAFSNPKRIDTWKKMMQRLNGELLGQILAAGPALAILDEAHRVKNSEAKRTKAIQQIAAGEVQLLMLTGTPLRNNEHEAAVLLSLLDSDASKTLNKKNGYTIQDVKDYLGYFMIRRTKAEVLPELPEKTRQRIEISTLDSDRMVEYYEALDWAQNEYENAISEGKTEAEARQRMQGGIEKARTALGSAKVEGGEVVDLILDVIENKECCVVFCAHHNASDMLKLQLEREKLRVAIIDGRVNQKNRAKIVSEFQAGLLDVVIGGIQAAGEAITLTRADTVIFVELDWVPAALLQAEDRVHRVGQKNNCQIIHLIARTPGKNLDNMMTNLLLRKMGTIGNILDEDTQDIIAGSVQSELRNLLLQQGKSVTKEDYPLAKSTDDKHKQEDHQKPVKVTDVKKQNKQRGRPKIYIDKAPPNATERSQQSIKTLTAAGGKRLMLRLTPEAHEALKAIMALTGEKQETGVINQALISRMHELQDATSTSK